MLRQYFLFSPCLVYKYEFLEAPFGRHRKKVAQYRGFTLHSFTNFYPDLFQENHAR